MQSFTVEAWFSDEIKYVQQAYGMESQAVTMVISCFIQVTEDPLQISQGCCTGNSMLQWHIPWNMYMVLWCFVLFWTYIPWQIQQLHLSTTFRVASLALGQSCDCPSASVATLKNTGKIWVPNHNKTQQSLPWYALYIPDGRLISPEFNSLAPGRFECNFQMDFSHWWFMHFLWNWPNMNVTGLHWWSLNIGSGNGLVPSGNKPLPEPILTHIYVATWRH